MSSTAVDERETFQGRDTDRTVRRHAGRKLRIVGSKDFNRGPPLSLPPTYTMAPMWSQWSGPLL